MSYFQHSIQVTGLVEVQLLTFNLQLISIKIVFLLFIILNKLLKQTEI